MGLGWAIKKAKVEGKSLRKIGPYIKKRFGIKKAFIALDRKIGNSYRKRYAKRIKVNDNQVFFYTFQGTYTCNPKYISEELERRNADVTIYWALKNPKSMGEFSDSTRVIPVKINIYEYFEAAMSSKILITNAIIGDKNYMIPIKKNQVLIETWHGSLGLKRFDPKSYNSSKDWPKAMAKTGKQTSYCISNSAFEDDVYRDTFWAEGTEIMRFGHPRNDILFDDGTKTAEILDKVLLKYKVFERVQKIIAKENKDIEDFVMPEIDKKDIHFIMYAPTFRDDHNFSVYNIDFNMLLDTLTEKYGGHWFLLLRYHPTVLQEQKTANKLKSPRIVNVSNYTDIQELMLIADMGISDYSSWMFDYMLTRKPLFVYAADLAFYKSERSFYYPIESTPFPVAVSNNKLIENIKNFNNEEYVKKVNEFIEGKGCVDDGLAAKRTVDLILKIIEDSKNSKSKKKKK